MKVNSHTGSLNYSGTIEGAISRLMFDITWVGNVGEADAVTVSVALTGKNFTGTIIPELSIAQLSAIAGFIDGLRYDSLAGKRVKFSIPISLGGAFDNLDGVITYTVKNATANNTIAVWAIDDIKKEKDFITLTQVGMIANASRNLSVTDAVYLFLLPAVLTRLKLTYAGGRSIEYDSDELQEICRVVNPIQSVTAVGAMVSGFPDAGLMGINIIDAVELEIIQSSGDNILLMKHVLTS